MPESIVWFTIGEKYCEYVIDKPVREYYSDGNGALTAGGSSRRAAQNYYLWRFEVNNLLGKYWYTSPKDMLKAVVGMSMDGFRTKRSIRTILADCRTIGGKFAVLSFMWAGFILSHRD